MADIVDSATRSRMMSGIRGSNTTPELFLRHTLHSMGFRYRLGGDGLPGRPDLIFPGKRVAVFVHGCFWHLHGCEFSKTPRTNVDFWTKKLSGNKVRDKKNLDLLVDLGWNPVVIWECDLLKRGEQHSRSEIGQLVKILAK